jgi:hypothetical protein
MRSRPMSSPAALWRSLRPAERTGCATGAGVWALVTY